VIDFSALDPMTAKSFLHQYFSQISYVQTCEVLLLWSLLLFIIIIIIIIIIIDSLCGLVVRVPGC
jgi:hypothetical protein